MTLSRSTFGELRNVRVFCVFLRERRVVSFYGFVGSDGKRFTYLDPAATCDSFAASESDL